MENAGYLFAAYTIIWAFVFVFVLVTLNRQRKLRVEIETLKKTLMDREGTRHTK
jgi:CcmD family protein